jgi:hypothetical protein
MQVLTEEQTRSPSFPLSIPFSGESSFSASELPRSMFDCSSLGGGLGSDASATSLMLLRWGAACVMLMSASV